MKPANPGVKLTHDDFLLFPDDGRRHELIDGEHYVTPSPVTRHQRIVGNLFFALRIHLETHPVGEVIGFPLDVILSKHDVVEPDLLYVAKERRDSIFKDWARGAPDLVVEIGSPSTRRRDADDAADPGTRRVARRDFQGLRARFKTTSDHRPRQACATARS